MNGARRSASAELGRSGFGTLLCTVGFQCRREGKECSTESAQGAQASVLRNDELGLAGTQGVLFLLAWRLIAVQKACQKPLLPRGAIIEGLLIDLPEALRDSPSRNVSGMRVSLVVRESPRISGRPQHTLPMPTRLAGGV